MRHGYLLAAATTALLAFSAAASDQDGFVDEFATLDSERWFVSDGWVNGPHQNCLWSQDAVLVENGLLHLSVEQAEDGPEDYICAEIQSHQRFGYGVYEARVRVPFATGTNSNFFTFIGPPQGLLHNEIDFEFLSATEPVLQTNIYFDGEGGNEDLTPVPNVDDWLDLAFIWEPGRLRWYMDGALIRTEESDRIPAIEQKMYLSIWTTDLLIDWMGLFEWSEPLIFQVDWVAFTPLGTGCLFDASILCDAEIQFGALKRED
ncbi:family 16 glycosylhydrolase [Roseinatronobacter bogoriensis]|uniref:Beta-glucanase n=1 Tax=Roseinatronobacter bogoriensis subsp. barguzinensis TaxID=441209 RepID=A0A2K8KCE2_9RHOB|nr:MULTISPECIES: family 16 glycosylhydrolase [Rhodobaca]ATX67121.1 1,3-1,4-beta-glycanase [Rhodobaca barguzinensis]MBB4206639.1 endo-1,3-1,4-beta-glycanase ExoK [Rhodobaca bogoriensis DSM 18756]TDW41383.1 endo-1,3-1,4-beta-glycanase ExoK [Rhodobaca barguzinensis]TDY74439.1 endo-1,3(4)-beta-glucanase [Rhodobaca bogoriensis DSM 18756]